MDPSPNFVVKAADGSTLFVVSPERAVLFPTDASREEVALRAAEILKIQIAKENRLMDAFERTAAIPSPEMLAETAMTAAEKAYGDQLQAALNEASAARLEASKAWFFAGVMGVLAILVAVRGFFLARTLRRETLDLRKRGDELIARCKDLQDFCGLKDGAP